MSPNDWILALPAVGWIAMLVWGVVRRRRG
jgi:hypothetical protein